MVKRREFLQTMGIGACLAGLSSGAELPTFERDASFTSSKGTDPTRESRTSPPMNRREIVRRHNPVLRGFDAHSPLSVGNGEFAFTCDPTGLQTFPNVYKDAMPLCTMSQWGWHSTPPRPNGEPRLTNYDTHGRSVGYHTSSEGQSELFNWLRENPHRLHLGRIGLRIFNEHGNTYDQTSIKNIEQTLDLWTGVITSRFSVYGTPVLTRTAVHPEIDAVAFSVNSSLFLSGSLIFELSFPYGSPSMDAADWSKPNRHQTLVLADTANGIRLQRTVDETHYTIGIRTSKLTFKQVAEHNFRLEPTGPGNSCSLVVAFFQTEKGATALPDADSVFKASATHWTNFWSMGGAIDFSGSKDTRAPELERRVVLSQYLTAIQCSGSLPPQETGLTVNSWYGKFHLEMHWWHACHFALWNRLPLFERSLAWYEKILPVARDLARSQGYRGVRWPKMVGPEGRDSPSPVGPLLIWQQPHPLFYAELCFLTRPTRATLKRYSEVVFETAEFMADFAYFDAGTDRYVLGPPVIPAQENHPAKETWNPTFELAYWSFALETAQVWRRRLGLRRNSKWDDVLRKLSKLPARSGVYLAHENCPQTFTERNYDHPSMLYAVGFVPGNRADAETMRRTLRKVMAEWQWNKAWGWDFPAVAMTASKLGEPSIAIDALMMNTEKNSYLVNGHNWQRENLPCYLPGNGGLLYAVALMAAGWKDSRSGNAPGFPADGSWVVRAEGFNSKLIQQL